MRTTEQWRSINHYDGAYSVSNKGRVRRDSGGPGAKKGRILSPGLHSKGYYLVNLSLEGVRSMHRVHRLVCEAFLGPCGDRLQVNHRNGIKTDNRVSNLEYMTSSEDTQHAGSVLGVTVIKLSPAKVRSARKCHLSGETVTAIARRFGVCFTTMDSVIRRLTWKHVA